MGAKEEDSIGPIQRPIISVCAVRKGPQVVQNGGNVGEGDDLAQAQRDDPELTLLIHLKQVSDDNDTETQQNASLKKYSSVWGQLELQDQRLVRVPPPYSNAASKVQVVLPKMLVASVLNQLHSSVTGGHLVIQKLQEKLRDRFYWPGWFADVRQWCRQCVDCASRKTHGKPPCAPMNPSVTSCPHERIALDILRPLPETSKKHKYILVVSDYFSKWTEAFPLPNQEAQTVACVMVE